MQLQWTFAALSRGHRWAFSTSEMISHKVDLLNYSQWHRGCNLCCALNSHYNSHYRYFMWCCCHCSCSVLSVCFLRGFVQDVLPVMSFLSEVCWCMDINVRKYKCNFYSRILLLHMHFFVTLTLCLALHFYIVVVYSNLIEDNARQFQQDWEMHILFKLWSSTGIEIFVFTVDLECF